DDRGDLFGLGCVLYEACTGRKAFILPPRAGGLLPQFQSVLADRPPMADEINPSVPDYLANAIHRLLDPNPDGKFSSAAEVRDLFAEYARRIRDTDPLCRFATNALELAMTSFKAQQGIGSTAAHALCLWIINALQGCVNTFWDSISDLSLEWEPPPLPSVKKIRDSAYLPLENLRPILGPFRKPADDWPEF